MQTQSGAAEEVVVSHRGSELQIVRRWFNSRTIGLTVFVVILNGILIFALSKIGAFDSEPLQLLDLGSLVDHPARLVNIGFISVAIFYTYKTIADWLNRTCIVVNREKLSVRHGPVPWPGVGPIRVADIKQFHTSALASHSGRGQYQKTTFTYEVHSEMNDGRSLKLIGGFATVDQAMRVKVEIDGHLGLKTVQEAPQSVQAPDGSDTHMETALNSTRQVRQAVTGPSDPETNIQSVLAIWLFIIVWNGAVWSVALMLWDSPRLKNAEVGFVFFAFFALIGFGLICAVAPATWRFFRQKVARRPNPATGKSGWFAVICLLAIAAGFALILTAGMRMHNEQDSLLRRLQLPATWHK